MDDAADMQILKTPRRGRGALPFEQHETRQRRGAGGENARRRIAVGLARRSAGSNNDFDMFEEMDSPLSCKR